MGETVRQEATAGNPPSAKVQRPCPMYEMAVSCAEQLRNTGVDVPQRPPKPLYPRWLPVAAWLSVGLAVVTLFGVCPLRGGDLWMHLTVGRWTWQHGWPPLVDEFS